MADSIRIGDTERDEAISLLQEHHAAGRLSTDEFDERMGKALQAKYAADLRALFDDLPGRKPGESAPAADFGVVPPATYGRELAPARGPSANSRALWLAVPVTIFILLATSNTVGLPALAPFMVVLVVFALMSRRRRSLRQAWGMPQLPPRPLTVDGRSAILDLLRVGNDRAALALYRDLTLADEPSAARAVLALRRELGR